MTDFYLDGALRERRDDDTRTYTAWDAAGAVTEQRPYTAEENAAADTRALQAQIVAARLAFDRAQVLTVATQFLELQAFLLAQAGTQPDQAWATPADIFHSYPKGWHVTHAGKAWRSTRPANVWEPGDQGWTVA